MNMMQTRVKTATPVQLPVNTGPLQRKCSGCGTFSNDDERKDGLAKRLSLQRRPKVGTTQATIPLNVHEVLRSPGQPLDPGTREFMEPRFGHDFSRVRVHTDSKAAESAQALNANAYTVGSNIVFAPGRFLPGSAEGQRLLAHELTHVLQQSGGIKKYATGGNKDSYEVEADRVADAVTKGASVQLISRSGLALQKEDGPGDAQARANQATLMCDMTTLCQLRFSNPEIVNRETVFTAYRTCNPGSSSILTLDPCLFPGPSMIQSIVGGAGPAAARPAAGAPASGGGGGITMPSTDVHFSLGAATFDVSLPSSVSATLPIPFRGARNIVLNLSASVSGEFSFSVTINAVPHVRIIARAGVRATGDQRATAGLVIETTRTTCQAVDEAAARTMLQGAGEKLRDAIRNLQNPPPQPSGQSDIGAQLGPTARWADVGSAIYGVHSAIESVRAGCHEVPIASVEFGARIPLEPFAPSTPPTERDRGLAPYVGGTATFHF